MMARSDLPRRGGDVASLAFRLPRNNGGERGLKHHGRRIVVGRQTTTLSTILPRAGRIFHWPSSNVYLAKYPISLKILRKGEQTPALTPCSRALVNSSTVVSVLV